MAIDPRISLAVQTPQASQAINIFENALMNKQTRSLRASQEARAAELQPFKVQQQQQTSDINQQALDAERNKQRITSLFQTGQRLTPFLESGDIEGAKQFIRSNISHLQDRIAAGDNVNIEDSMETLRNLEAGDTQRVMSDIQGVNSIVNQQRGQRLTPRQVEFQQFKNMPIDTKEQRETKEQFGKAIGAISKLKTTEEKLDFVKGKTEIETKGAIEKTKGVTRAKLREQTLALPAAERVKFLSENRASFTSDVALSKNILDEIDRAIEIWETAPSTISGPIAGRTISLADDTQELESILAGLGIDRLSAFKGATSERELATAFRAGASIEQDSKAGLARLKKQRKDITRNNDRLRGLLNESNGLLRKSQARLNEDQPTDTQGELSAEDQAELEQLEAEFGNR